ncbi:hypothetical protein ANO11243_082160 [Dothideomycetidae sp. 11243]|nr:hypothetical protein ANO11243_082160 [fungal sp. No.11243]
MGSSKWIGGGREGDGEQSGSGLSIHNHQLPSSALLLLSRVGAVRSLTALDRCPSKAAARSLQDLVRMAIVVFRLSSRLRAPRGVAADGQDGQRRRPALGPRYSIRRALSLPNLSPSVPV